MCVCKRDNLLPQDNASFHPDSPAQYRKLLILVVPVLDICTLDDLKTFMKPWRRTLNTSGSYRTNVPEFLKIFLKRFHKRFLRMFLQWKRNLSSCSGRIRPVVPRLLKRGKKKNFWEISHVSKRFLSIYKIWGKISWGIPELHEKLVNFWKVLRQEKVLGNSVILPLVFTPGQKVCWSSKEGALTSITLSLSHCRHALFLGSGRYCISHLLVATGWRSHQWVVSILLCS